MSEVITTPPTPFVGREAELHQLGQILKMVITTQQPKFALIQGDVGVGKTALVTRFMSEASSQHLTLLSGQGRCAMEKEGSGMLPFGQLLVTLSQAGIQRGAILGDPSEFIQEVAPAWSDIFTACAASTGLKSAVKTVEEGRKLLGRSAYTEENVLMQFTNVLTKLAEKHPILAFIDDLQWADESSLRLVFHLARCLQNRSVLFVCAYRPVEAMETGPDIVKFRDIRANLICFRTAVELELRQGINVADYATQRYPLNAFSQEFIAHAQELTGGHALFVSELFSLWQDTGVIALTSPAYEQAVWISPRGAEAQSIIPKTLSEVLEERIRRLEDELRRSLTIASVEGEDFTTQVIARLQQLDEDKVYDGLDTLEHRYRLIQEQEQKPETSSAPLLDFYRFVHRFFRDYIYSKLGSAKRRTLHGQVGECLEALYSDRRPIAGQLALHFREARKPMRAAEYTLMAAEFEQSHYAWAEGEKWCEFGLELLEKLSADEEIRHLQETAAPTQRRLAEARENLCLIQERENGFVLSTDVPLQFVKEERRWRNEIAELEQQLDGAASMPKQLLQLNLLEQSGYGYFVSAQYPQAEQRYREALTFAQQLQDAERIASLYNLLVDIYEYQGRLEETQALVDQGSQLLADHSIPFGKTHFSLETMRGFLQVRFGHPDLAVRYINKALADAKCLPQTPEIERIQSIAYNMLGIAFTDLCRYPEALAAYQKSIEMASKVGDKKLEAAYLLNLAECYSYLVKLDDSLVYISKGLKIARQIGDLENVAWAQALKGDVMLTCGRPQDALTELTEALTLSEQLGSLWNMPCIYAELALAYLALSDLDTAYQRAVRGVDYATEKHLLGPFGLGYALDALARVETAQQDWASALQHFSQAITLYQEMPNQHLVGLAQRHLAEALLRKGERFQAIELLETALATFQELDLAYEVAETQRLWDMTQIQ